MFLKHIWPGLVWALFILILCAIPGKELPNVWWLELLSIDKLIHALLFAVLVVLLSRGFMRQNKFNRLQTHPVTISIAVSIPYGFMLELMQRYLIEGRTFDLLDALANSIGCLAGWYYLNKQSKRIKTGQSKGFE